MRHVVFWIFTVYDLGVSENLTAAVAAWCNVKHTMYVQLLVPDIKTDFV